MSKGAARKSQQEVPKGNATDVFHLESKCRLQLGEIAAEDTQRTIELEALLRWKGVMGLPLPTPQCLSPGALEDSDKIF
jgi:hypothetical protein